MRVLRKSFMQVLVNTQPAPELFVMIDNKLLSLSATSNSIIKPFSTARRKAISFRHGPVLIMETPGQLRSPVTRQVQPGRFAARANLMREETPRTEENNNPGDEQFSVPFGHPPFLNRLNIRCWHGYSFLKERVSAKEVSPGTAGWFSLRLHTREAGMHG